MDTQPLRIDQLNGQCATYNAVRRITRERVPREVMFGGSKLAIVANALRAFDFGTPAPSLNDEATVADRCWEIMLAMEHPDLCAPVRDSSLVSLFMKEIVGLSRLPMHALAEIHRKVHGDLAVLARLIDGYLEHDSISTLLDKQQRPNNHEARKTVAFYVRCIKEQHALVRKLKRAEDEALSMSDQDLEKWQELWGFTFSWTLIVNQLSISHHLRIREFDAARIDRVFHRISHLSVPQGRQLASIYESGDLDYFYQELSRSLPPARVFDSMHARIRSRQNLLRLAPIIHELRLLFDREMWSGFYALALPQIEGVTAAMLATLGRKPGGSLTDNILSLWDRYSLANPVFDYFAWHLPAQRNRFAHSGRLPGEPRWVAHDALYDLHYILKVYEELDAPWIQVETLLKWQDTVNRIPDIQWLSQMIQGLDQIKKQRLPYPAAFSKFVAKLTLRKGEMDQLIDDFEQIFQEKAVPFVATFNAMAADVVGNFDLSKSSGYDSRSIRGPLLEIFEQGELEGRDVVIAYVRIINGLKKHMSLDYSHKLKAFKGLDTNLRQLGLV